MLPVADRGFRLYVRFVCEVCTLACVCTGQNDFVPKFRLKLTAIYVSEHDTCSSPPVKGRVELLQGFQMCFENKPQPTGLAALLKDRVPRRFRLLVRRTRSGGRFVGLFVF